MEMSYYLLAKCRNVNSCSHLRTPALIFIVHIIPKHEEEAIESHLHGHTQIRVVVFGRTPSTISSVLRKIRQMNSPGKPKIVSTMIKTQ